VTFLQGPLSRFTPPFDRGLVHAGLGEVVCQQFRFGRSGGEFVKQRLLDAAMQDLTRLLSLGEE
jgi:hypothetical protein